MCCNLGVLRRKEGRRVEDEVLANCGKAVVFGTVQAVQYWTRTAALHLQFRLRVYGAKRFRVRVRVRAEHQDSARTVPEPDNQLFRI